MTFFSYVQASKYFNCSIRNVKKYYNIKYIIDKNPLNNPNSKIKFCSNCNSPVLSKNARHDKCPNCKRKQSARTERYCKICNSKSCIKNRVNENKICKICTDKGLGRKLQGKIISTKYKGSNNPNYSKGTSKVYFYQLKEWKELKKITP